MKLNRRREERRLKQDRARRDRARQVPHLELTAIVLRFMAANFNSVGGCFLEAFLDNNEQWVSVFAHAGRDLNPSYDKDKLFPLLKIAVKDRRGDIQLDSEFAFIKMRATADAAFFDNIAPDYVGIFIDIYINVDNKIHQIEGATKLEREGDGLPDPHVGKSWTGLDRLTAIDWSVSLTV